MVCILRRIEAATLAIAEPIVHPLHGLVCNAGTLGIEERLIRVNVVLQESAVVISHLFEVRNDPSLVDAIAVKSSCEMIVDTAFGHLRKRHSCGELNLFVNLRT